MNAFSVENIFKKYKNLLFEARFWILTLVIVFIIGAIVGLLISLLIPQTSEILIKNYSESIDFGVSGLALSWFILERNLSIVVVASLAGFVLGIVPTFIAAINGLIFGVVIGFGKIYTTVTPWQLLWLLLPHGIFEYAASVLGLAFGLRWGLNWLVVRAPTNRKEVFQADFKKLLLILPVVVVLMVVAALIEGVLTLPIACLLAGVCR